MSFIIKIWLKVHMCTFGKVIMKLFSVHVNVDRPKYMIGNIICFLYRF